MLICFPTKEPKQLTPLLTFLSPWPLTASESGPTRSLPTFKNAFGEGKESDPWLLSFLWYAVKSYGDLKGTHQPQKRLALPAAFASAR